MSEPEPTARRRRRAVGPRGAAPAEEPVLDLGGRAPAPPPADDDERLRRDRPPHHDRGL